MIKQNAGMVFAYYPQRGQLFVQSSMGYETLNDTAGNVPNSISNVTIGQSIIPLIVIDELGGYSKGTLAGGIVGAVIGGFILGVLVLWIFSNLG